MNNLNLIFSKTGLSHDDLAYKLCMSPSMLYKLKSGERPVSDEFMKRLVIMYPEHMREMLVSENTFPLVESLRLEIQAFRSLLTELTGRDNGLNGEAIRGFKIL
jgi:predicted transcriptional regulator